jgi:hypothetical protein
MSAYRRSVCEATIEKMPQLTKLQRFAKTMTPGTAGLAQGMAPNLLDSAIILHRECMSNETVTNCFLKAKVLPVTHEHALSQVSRKYSPQRQISPEAEIAGYLEAVRGLSPPPPCPVMQENMLLSRDMISRDQLERIVMTWLSTETDSRLAVESLDSLLAGQDQ